MKVSKYTFLFQYDSGYYAYNSLSNIPPVCYDCSQDLENNCPNHTFCPIGGPDNENTPTTTPLYVPVGAKETYKNAEGWFCFENIIETDKFPTTPVSEIFFDNQTDDTIYDIMGRKVTHLIENNIYIQGVKSMLRFKDLSNWSMKLRSSDFIFSTIPLAACLGNVCHAFISL